MNQNEYTIFIENTRIIANGSNEFGALLNLDIFSDIRVIECLNAETQVWMYEVEINGRRTIAVTKRTDRKEVTEK